MPQFKILLIIIFVSIQTYSQTEFVKGIDISKLLQIEDNGGIFKESNIQQDALQIFSNHGANVVRLRIWHSPEDSYTNLEKTLVLAKRADSLGMKLLLDFHYSDTWADPGNQTIPAAWSSLSFENLNDSVYQYSYNVLTALIEQGTIPVIVQIGNEINCGILWNDGNVCGAMNTNAQWNKLAALLNSGIKGVKDALLMKGSTKIMIHYSEGGNNAACNYFFSKIIQNNVNFDIIGLSYYPWWHGSLHDLSTNMNALTRRFNKEILVTETAYPWTLDWNDDKHNIVGNSNQLLPGYSATELGQKDFLFDLVDTIKNISGNKAIGFVYWAPENISTSTLGSVWENVSLFNFDGEVLNSISIFEDELTNILDERTIPTKFKLLQNYPNPFGGSSSLRKETTIEYSTPKINAINKPKMRVTLKVYDLLGRVLTTIVDEEQNPGNYKILFNINSVNKPLSSGIYFYKLTINEFTETKKMIFLR